MIIIVAFPGTNRSQSDNEEDEDHMPFLAKSYCKLWKRLTKILFQKDLEQEPASSSLNIPAIVDGIGIEEPYRIQFEGTSRCDCKVHLYHKFSNWGIIHHICCVTDSRVDQW